MKAYTQGITKKEFVKEMKLHQKADNFIKGAYDKGEKGCAVGCSLKSVAKLKKINLSFDDHENYEKHLGVPEWLARVEDKIFEGVSLERSKAWPVEFSEAIKEGSDLDKIKTPFIVTILYSCIDSMNSVVFDEENNPDVVKAIEGSTKAVLEMIKCHEQGLDLSAAASAAWSAAWSAARSAEWSAAWSAESAAASAAWSAARSAARSAESAARSAESAARSAESAAASAESAAASAESAAASAVYEYYADELLKLMRECK